MTYIPDDIKRAAAAAWKAGQINPAAWPGWSPREIAAIEYALLAERERCAKIVEENAIMHGDQNSLVPRIEGDRYGIDYAAAIRRPTP